jgi:zinc/manganese transport system substrate-binding protein
MRTHRVFVPLVALLLLAPVSAPRAAAAAAAPVSVLTTTPDLADIVRTVGGSDVSVTALARGTEDPHFLDARPSFLRAANTAELLVVVGLGIEDGYLPLLLRQSANPRIRPGSTGYLDASRRINRIVPENAGGTRAMGDVHPLGNPHYLLDPGSAGVVAEDVARALSALRPDRAKAFDDSAARFREAIATLMLGPLPTEGKGERKGGYLDRFEPHRGANVVSYHDDLAYLARRLGLVVLGTLEPKPGVPPTAAHLADLGTRARAARVKVVTHTVFQPRGPVESFASSTGATHPISLLSTDETPRCSSRRSGRRPRVDDAHDRRHRRARRAGPHRARGRPCPLRAPRPDGPRRRARAGRGRQREREEHAPAHPPRLAETRRRRGRACAGRARRLRAAGRSRGDGAAVLRGVRRVADVGGIVAPTPA